VLTTWLVSVKCDSGTMHVHVHVQIQTDGCRLASLAFCMLVCNSPVPDRLAVGGVQGSVLLSCGE
jgi:hypothetical protein